MINLIVCHDRNRLIGDGDKLPWHISSELKHFKATTKNSCVVMGRKTFESLGMPNGLPGRFNVIISSNFKTDSENCIVIDNIKDALILAEQKAEQVFVIGGRTIYEQTFKYVKIAHVSVIPNKHEGDTYLPELPSTFIKIAEDLKDEFIYQVYYNMTPTTLVPAINVGLSNEW